MCGSCVPATVAPPPPLATRSFASPAFPTKLHGLGRLAAVAHPANRVQPTERIGRGFVCQRIGCPSAVHDEAILIIAGRQRQVLRPPALADSSQGRRFWLPAIKSAGKENRLSGWVGEFKMDLLRMGSTPKLIFDLVLFHKMTRVDFSVGIVFS